MANMLFDAARARALGGITGSGDAYDGDLNWHGATNYSAFLFLGASAPAATNSTLSTIANADWQYTSGGVAQTSGVAMTNLVVTTDGAADADDVTFTSVDSSNNTISAVFLADNTGTNGSGDPANKLLLWIDTATGLPITPNGGDIIVTWDQGATKIFRP